MQHVFRSTFKIPLTTRRNLTQVHLKRINRLKFSNILEFSFTILSEILQHALPAPKPVFRPRVTKFFLKQSSTKITFLSEGQILQHKIHREYVQRRPLTLYDSTLREIKKFLSIFGLFLAFKRLLGLEISKNCSLEIIFLSKMYA